MGRGSSIDEVAAVTVPIRGADPDGFEIIQPGAPPDIGSEAHRRRLEEYARARTDRFDISITLAQFCGRCRHGYDEHASGYCSVDDCECDRYAPGGGSFTDMKGNITIQSDVPPGAEDAARELCIRGLLRHEVGHELYTDVDTHREFVKELTRLGNDKQEITANQLKQLWNILEDGMLEERERSLEPGSYSYISALNKLHPRVGKTVTIEEEQQVPAPDDYIPRDADGNELEVREITAADGSKRKVVIIPAGTKISPWGEYPVSKQTQAESAVLAEAIPEFEPGELHPDVRKALDECQEHIDAAVRGNTADCVARAYQLQAILRNHDLLRGDLTDEEREELEQLAEALGQMMQNAPDVDPDGQPQPGGGQSPMNGMPMPQPGQQPMSDEMQDAMSGGSDGQQGGEQGDAKEQKAAGKDGDGKSAGDGQADRIEGTGKHDDKQQGAGSEAGDGEDGEPAGDKQQGAASEAGDGDSSEQPQSSKSQQGGFEGSGGYDANRALPKGTREKNQASGRGSVDKNELDKMLGDAKDDLAKDKADQTAADSAKLRRGEIEADNWRTPGGQRVTPQREITAGVRSQGTQALPSEQGDLSRLGRQLSARLSRINTVTRAPQRRLKRGALDPRRVSAAMAFNERVFQKKGQDLDLDMEIDVSIDRSGSVTMNNVDNTNQYRMAKMFGIAAKEAKVPMSIYGWDGSGSGAGTRHFAYKERHSDDLTGIDGIFQSGGGGTPTAEGVAFSRARLRRSRAKQKIMVVITDGCANDPASARAAVEKARSEGVRVIGMAFGVGSNVSPEQMNSCFGAKNWQPIESYTDAPRIIGGLIEAAARAKAQR